MEENNNLYNIIPENTNGNNVGEVPATESAPAVEPVPAVEPTPAAEPAPAPEAAPVPNPAPVVNTIPQASTTPAYTAPATPKPIAPAPTYSYTAGGDTTAHPVQSAYKPAYNQQGGVTTTYVPKQTTPPVSEFPKKKRKSDKGISTRTFSVFVALALILCALSGYLGASLGYNCARDDISASEDKNNKLDAKPGEKVEVELPEGTVAAAAELAGDSVVEITTETVTTSWFYGEYVQSGAGSGVIIDAENGYIITCAHVIDGASSVTVTLKNGEEYEAEIIGGDNRTDIAVIKVEAEGLTEAILGNSDNLVVGQTAIAIGNPLGTLGGTVSSGIISALNREITIEGQGYSLLQIDTSINPGNSGGGLFDIEGKLIGIVNAKSGGDGSGTTIEGLGFAIPINKALEIANDLVDMGYVGGRVHLGISVVEVTENFNSMQLYQSEYKDLLDYIDEYGVYFVEYQPGHKGDFKFGDRIIAIDGNTVSTRSDISSLLEEYEVGDEVTVTVFRAASDMKRKRVVEFQTTLIEQKPNE